MNDNDNETSNDNEGVAEVEMIFYDDETLFPYLGKLELKDEIIFENEEIKNMKAYEKLKRFLI